MVPKASAGFEPVAIIGSACRFPGGASSPEAFWNLLRRGTDFVGPVPAGRWDGEAIHDAGASRPGTTYCREGAFLDEVDRFDARFFGISASEAREMDPQQRLLLEVAWECMERAGLCAERLKGSRTAVYVGMLGMDYLTLHAREAGIPAINPFYAAGKEFSFAAGRIAYHLGVHGPAMAVSTACSSSLVAIHLGCRALQNREADLAIAAGVNLMLSPELTIYMSQIKAISPSGRCRVFDAAADGIVRGEGGGALLLKRLEDARADGDPILAVIRGSAINQDGESAGQTVPNANAQAAVVRAALDAAGLEIDDIAYVEAHGTGTPLGDPIELSSLAEVFRQRKKPLLVGSVKANMGHLDAAAGMASVIKTMQLLRHGEVPPQLHLVKPNALVDWQRSSLRVATSLETLPEGPRLAGVSAFGLSGTNVHLILEGADSAEAPPDAVDIQRTWVLPVSAKTEAAVHELARRYAQALPEEDAALRTFVARVASYRDHHVRRAALVGGDAASLRQQLAYLGGGTLAVSEIRDGKPADGPVFVYTGQGAQWLGMATGLLQREPAFLETIRLCDRHMREWSGWSIETELLRPAGESRLHLTEIAQPAIFAIQVALTECLRRWGVTPGAVVGHSMGEVAAAWCAGALDLRSAVQVIYHRANAMKGTLGGGRMMVVGASAEELQPMLGPSLEISVVNSHVSCVVSGEAGAVAALEQRLGEAGRFTFLMPAPYAFHSWQMEPCLADIQASLADIEPDAAKIPWISSSAANLQGEYADAAYWVRNARGVVRFDRAIERLLEDGARLFVELGPHAVLAQSIQQLAVRAGKAARVFSALQREGDGSTELAAILAGLYENGVAPDWKAYQGDAGFVELPTYPWQREAYWFQATQGVPARAQALHARVQVFDAEGRLCATAEDVALCTVDEPAAALANVPAKKAGARPAVTLAQAREVVSAALSEILGVPCDELDAERGFFELGLTSISLIEFKRKLEARVGLELPATVGFDYPNLEALARRLEQLGAAKEIQPTTCAPAARGADTGHEVAVLGMACRLPRADSPEALWEVLLEQATCVVPVPSSRLTEPVNTRRHASLVERVEGFDEDFFRISPREAGSMDPQQRLFLMVAWEALERAGIPPHDLRERQVGVFVGANAHDYEARLLACAAGIDANYGTGSAFSAISGRLSHFLGLRGPSLTVDTACSSSLTAVHLACNSLLAGECEIAIVGGVNVIASSAIFQSMGDAGALSADGTCKTFDDRADGYGRGEGCGVVILKRAERARADGDRVIAVLLGSAVNHDGACAGLTVPNGPAQEALIREALANASLSAAAVGYVEAHGTGTVLGDPIELQALANAYRGTERVPLAVASVKGNVGHLEAAAGIASLIKACLVVERGVIPGQAGFQRPNSRFDWQATSLQVPQANQPWEVPAAERIAGISAFGFTGTNVHVLLRGEVRDPSERSDGDGSRPWPLCLSAHTDEALRDMAASYERFLAAGEASAAAVCRSAALGRSPLKARLLVFGRGSAELAVALADWRRGIDASMPAELDEGTRSACTAFLNGQPADWLAVFGDVRAWVDLPTYPWQLRDYWLEYGVREPALEDDHPCLLLHSRGMGGEWQWLGRLPEEKSGDETHWHPSGALLLDALLQALAVAEPERAFALVEMRLSVPRFSRCGPLASRLTLSLSDKASITLALRGEHDHEWRDVLSAVPLECASPDVDQLELSPADLGQAEAGLVAAALEGQRDGRYGNYRFPLRSDAARRRLLLAETLALFEGAHAAPVVGFARVQVLDDLPEHIAVRVSGAELGRLQSLYAVDEDGCVVALFEGPLLLADEPEQLALADEPAASFLVARWEDFPDEPVVRKSGEWRLLLPGGAGMSRLVSAFSARGLGVREMPWEDVPDSSEWLAEAALDTTCEGLLVPCCGDCDEQRFADFLLALGRAVATCPTGKPIWFLHPPAERADAAAARRLGILYGATRALALEQPAWWGGVVELDPADGRGLHRFARLLVGVPRHDHLKIRGTRVFARYLEVRPAASRRIGSASAGGGTVLLHVRAGTDLTPYLLLSPVRRARRLVVLCEQPPRLPVEWAGAPLPETLIVDCADRRALAEVLGRLQAEQSITGFIQARPEWTAGRLEEPTSATRVAAARREMHALENFHGLLAGQPLAFFLILGSLSSLLGGAGFAHQAMVDGFALWLHGERRRAGLPCQLLLGLQTEAELDGLHEVRQRLLGSGLQPLKEERFVRALETLLEEPDGCVGLADGVDWAQLKPLYQNELPWPLLDRLGQPSATVPERAAGFARMPEHLRRRALAALVAEQVAAVFGYPDADAIERSKGFTEMGMSSVMSLDFRSRLGRALGLQLPATFAFEYCSIDAVTDYLALHLQAGPAPVSTEPPARPAQEPGERREISALSRSELIDALEEELRDIENY